MAIQPISHSDLVKDDGAIRDLIEELQSLSTTIKKSQKDIKSEAALIEKSLDGITGATLAQREQISEAAKRTDDLGKAYRKLDKALGENNKQIQEVLETTRQVNKLRKLEAKVNTSTAGSYDNLSAQLAILKIRYRQLSKEQQLHTKEGKALAKQIGVINQQFEEEKERTRQLNRLKKLQMKVNLTVAGTDERRAAVLKVLKFQYRQLTDEQKDNTKSGQQLVALINQINDELKNSEGRVGSHGRKVGDYKNQMRELIEELNQTPGALGNFSGGLQNVTDQAKKLLRNPLVAFLAAVAAGLAVLGRAFFSTERGARLMERANNALEGSMLALSEGTNIAAEGLERMFSNGAKEGFKEIGKIIKQNFENRILSVGVAIRAVANRDLAGLRTAAIQAFTGFDENDQNATVGLFGKLAEKADFYRIALDALTASERELARQNVELTKTAEKYATAEAIAQVNANDTTTSFEQQKKAVEDLQAAQEGRLKAELRIAQNNLKLVTSRLNLEKSAGKDITNLLEQQARALGEVERANRELTVNTLENAKLRQEITRDEFERELDFAIDFYDAQKTQLEKQVGDEKKALSERVAIVQRLVELDRSAFAEQTKLVQDYTGQRIDLNSLAQEDDERVVRERLKQYQIDDIVLGRILEILRERKAATQDILDLEKDLTKAKAKEIGEVPALLPQIGIFGNKTEQEIRDEAFLKFLDMRNKLASDLKKENPQDIFDLLGFDVPESQKGAIKSSFDFAKQQLAEYVNAIKAAADAQVQAADRTVSAKENELNRQIQLQALGEASRVEGARRELAEAQENQRKALEQQRKAQRQQIALQTIAQASNLVTGISQLFVKPGFPAALPLVALMIGSFAAAKIAALRATKTEFAHGGYEFIGGGSHASGNDTPLGFSSKGKPAYAERGEFHGIVRKQMVPKYRRLLPTLIDSLNAGNFEERFLRISAAGKDLPLVINSAGTDTRKMERQLSQLVKQGGEKVYQQGGKTIIRKGSWTTIIR